MRQYHTANGDHIEVVAPDDSLSFADDISLGVDEIPGQRSTTGSIQSDTHDDKLQRIFDRDLVFDIIVEPAGTSSREEYNGCMLQRGHWEWECP